MNSQTIGYILLIVIGAVCAILSMWVYLLAPETRFLLFALVGLLTLVAGIVRLRRARKGL